MTVTLPTTTSSIADPTAADAWERLGRLGRARDLDGLAAEFAAGTLPPRDLRGPGDHDLVVTILHPLADRVLAALVAAVPRPLPWLGKSFDPDAGRGINDFHRLLGPPLRLAAPVTGWQPGPHGPQAFGFDTYAEAGAIDPAPRVLVLDYPWPGRPIRDEMVMVAPGVYLGRALLRGPGDTYRNVAYWRLHTASAGTDR